ncbi:hypothetical protein BU16DRAFT_543552 [Lophium mytilinum]|uniref:F-box domain-containing protein n=1 Tax=Lophium mytilinum TaxID=390894 RepID=A0A6A6QF11_9PEZI|nr:hypothetical protein BU16DRAFT_543552 [Lophium mytilinum]
MTDLGTAESLFERQTQSLHDFQTSVETILMFRKAHHLKWLEERRLRNTTASSSLHSTQSSVPQQPTIKRHKRGREPDEGGDVEEIPRSEPADVQGGKPLLKIQRDENETITTRAKRVKISSLHNRMEVTVHFDANGEVQIRLQSTSLVRPYLKDIGNLMSGDETSFIVQASCHRQSPTIFPFLRLPAELRIMIYDLALDTFQDGWLPRYRKGDPQSLCSPRRLLLGSAQPFLNLNRQIRTEVNERVVYATHLNFAHYCELARVREVLEHIDDSGRDAVKEIRGIQWWSEIWADSDRRVDDADVKDAVSVVGLLKSCRNLEILQIEVPERRGMGANRLKKSRFLTHCGLLKLSSVRHVPQVDIIAPTSNGLEQWLEHRMRSIEGLMNNSQP